MIIIAFTVSTSMKTSSSSIYYIHFFQLM